MGNANIIPIEPTWCEEEGTGFERSKAGIHPVEEQVPTVAKFSRPSVIDICEYELVVTLDPDHRSPCVRSF